MGAVVTVPDENGSTSGVVVGGARATHVPPPLLAHPDGEGLFLASEQELLRQTRSQLASVGPKDLAQRIFDNTRTEGISDVLDSEPGRLVLSALAVSLIEGDEHKHARTLAQSVHCANSWTDQNFNALKVCVLSTLQNVLRDAWSPAVSAAYQQSLEIFLNCWLAGVREFSNDVPDPSSPLSKGRSPRSRKKSSQSFSGKSVSFGNTTQDSNHQE